MTTSNFNVMLSLFLFSCIHIVCSYSLKNIVNNKVTVVLSSSSSLLLKRDNKRINMLNNSNNSKHLFDIKSNHIIKRGSPPSSSYQTRLYGFSDYDESKSSSISFKIIGILILGIVGLFGSDIFGSLSTIKTNLIEQSRPSSISDLKGGTTTNRGSLTRLTRKEINLKLSQIPVFYISIDEGKSIYLSYNGNSNSNDVNNNEANNNYIGTFFIDKINADEYILKNNIQNSKIYVTTIDKIYYPLLIKKQKIISNNSFMDSVVINSNPSAKYQLEGSLNQLLYTSKEWQLKHNNNNDDDDNHNHDIPLFRIPGLAFQKENEGIVIPLFLKKEDALNSYQRLLDSKQSNSNIDSSKSSSSSFNDEQQKSLSSSSSSSLVQANEVIVQVTSLYDMIDLFSSGGFEGRAIEFYPSIDAINYARELMK